MKYSVAVLSTVMTATAAAASTASRTGWKIAPCDWRAETEVGLADGELMMRATCGFRGGGWFCGILSLRGTRPDAPAKIHEFLQGGQDLCVGSGIAGGVFEPRGIRRDDIEPVAAGCPLELVRRSDHRLPVARASQVLQSLRTLRHLLDKQVDEFAHVRVERQVGIDMPCVHAGSLL